MAKTYRVVGMSCGGCASSVERAIKAVLPAASVSVNLDAKAVTVDGADDDAKIRQAVEDAGFTYEGLSA
jgi:copper chaperone